MEGAFLRDGEETIKIKLALLRRAGLRDREANSSQDAVVLGKPQGPYHTKNATVIVIHYVRSKTTTVANHYGRVSETPCFPGENSQEISTNSELLRR